MTTLPATTAPALFADAPRPDDEPRGGLGRAGVVTAYLAAVAIPWNGFFLGGLLPGDLLLLLSLMLFAASDLGRPWPRLPAWAWGFAALIVVVTVAHELLPTDPLYLAQRVVVDAAGNPIPEIHTNLGVGGKYLVPIVGMPMAFAFAQLHSSGALRRLMIAFGVGSGISSFLAFAQVLGVTNLPTQLTGVPIADGRSAGLAVHPNFLATPCVMCIPIVMWFALQPAFRDRVYGVSLGLLQLLGIYASGSRGGAAVTALAVVVSIAIMPVYRRVLPTAALFLSLIGAVAFVASPKLGTAVLKAVRLTGGDTTISGSDYVRSQVGAQGIRDFKHSPIDGVGMQVAAEAHNVYIQAMASGGLLLLAGLILFLGGALVRAARARQVQPLAYPLIAAVFSGAVLASLENSLTDRLAYVPAALCALLPAVHRTKTPEVETP